MYQKPMRPALIGSIVDDAVKLYRASFRRCAPIAVLGALVSAALDLFVVGFAHHEGMPFNSLESSLLVYQQPPIIALGLLQSVILLALFGALLVTQNAVANGVESIRFTDAIGIGFTRLGRFVMATVVYVLITLLGCLLIVPGIYIGNVWSVYPAAIFVDDASGLNSLEISRRLTAGYWWHTATVLGVAAAVVLVFAMTADFGAGLIAMAGSPGAAGVQSAMQLVGDAADVVVLPMMPAALLALYNDLKLRQRAGPRQPSGPR
jgi:hypothetical protein